MSNHVPDTPDLDHAGRAHTHIIAGNLRIRLEKIGFWPGNRSGMGIVPYHVHEVAHDIIENGIKIERYGHVKVVKIPASKRAAIIATNRRFCERDSLMPTHDDQIEYVAVSKTHFTFANKLIANGNRKLYNIQKGNVVRMQHRSDDQEGRTILKHGVLACVYAEELFKDLEAMGSVASQDNLNALTTLSEREIDAWFKVDTIFNQLKVGDTNPS